MRTRLTHLSILALGTLVPVVAHAAIPFFGPIIPDAQQYCPGSWGLVITVVNNAISFAITMAITIVAPATIAYAGFLFVTNPYSPGNLSKAKSMLGNVVLGIVVALSAWIIVDAIMAVLYSPSAAGGTWSALITSGGIDPCLKQSASLNTLNATSVQVTGSTSKGGGGVYVDGKSAAVCSDANTACSPAALQAAGFNEKESLVMSCIAMTESSGNPGVGCNGNACGIFQIMLTQNPLVGPSCAQYNNGSALINCPALCKGANGAAVKNEKSCEPCAKAARDPKCNAEAARYLYSKSAYKPWTTQSDNTKSAACVRQYSI